MKIEHFEAELRELDPNFTVRVAPANPEMAGIYWKDLYICACPAGEIFDEPRRDYKNSVGIPHRTRPTALAQAKQYLWRLKNEPGFLEDEMSFKNDTK